MEKPSGGRRKKNYKPDEASKALPDNSSRSRRKAGAVCALSQLPVSGQSDAILDPVSYFVTLPVCPFFVVLLFSSAFRLSFVLLQICLYISPKDS
mmetsp:Transcript_37128/g.73066  ORF Transcript_37128/g.73066 Transcript_37128/m.73066 type:complete len:95 (-) Transcript_37128:1463-1747(-)